MRELRNLWKARHDHTVWRPNLVALERSSMEGPSVFDLSESARPGGSEAAGGREKTKTENAGGAGAQQGPTPQTGPRGRP